MKIFLALKQVDFALKMFAAAGFNNFSAAFEAKNENALKEFLTSAKSVEKIVEKVVEPTEEQIGTLLSAELREHIVAAGFTLAADADPLAALKAGLAAHQSLQTQFASLNSLLASAGIKLVASDPKVGLTAADVTKAVEGRVSLKDAELTAQIGTAPIATQVAAAPAAAVVATAASTLTGLAKVQASFEADLKK